LHRLSRDHGRVIALGEVPEAEMEGWRDLGLTHVWLMGVWATGPRCQRHSAESPGLREALREAFPGYQEADVSGSPYAPAGYRVPASLGGDSGLRVFRQRLHNHGLKLLLDFVPNHVGLDHPWLKQHPELFVQAPQPRPGTFEVQTSAGPVWVAHGKDPNFPPWTDTAQLDYRRLETQRAVAQAFQSIARRCDGVRCDMAMLILREVFEAQWHEFPAPGPTPEGEFWSNLIRQTRQQQPDFLFLAEAYWDLEARLQVLGFDYTYDKRLYDYLVNGCQEEVRRHLHGVGAEFLRASAHFLENHDEPRIATRLALAEHKAAALAVLGLPGLRLIHEGQLAGSRLRLPVQLCHSPEEPEDPEISGYYRTLLQALRFTGVGGGDGLLLVPRAAWPGNPTHERFVIVQWRDASEAAFDLVVSNLAPHRSQCYVSLAVPELGNRNWRMQDLLGTEEYRRYGDDLQSQGLYLDVPAHAAQLFRFTPLS
jgi:hypothetical protein